ncbi:MAG: glycosyltransferase family 39 protein, partial [Planctomycetes bacterium]|nr:glycosyltransferase family 39 protein [Planctomycetota bacterium]
MIYGRFTSQGWAAYAYLVLTLLLLSLAVAYMLVRWKVPFRPTLVPYSMDAEWIVPAGGPSFSACFRTELILDATPLHAWIAVSAVDAFELTINGDTVGRMFLWRPTRPFQNGLSEGGQRVSPLQVAMALNFPREFQWRGHRSHMLPVFFDVHSFLQPGKNTICLQVESRQAKARACVEGEILLATGERKSVSSGAHWLGEPFAPTLQAKHWCKPSARVNEWRRAELAEAPAGGSYSFIPTRAFKDPFRGKFLHSPTAASHAEIVYESEWLLDGEPAEAWIRVLVNRPFHLLINGSPVRVARPRKPDLDAGDWIMGRERALDVSATPELLDPDEVGEVHSGKRFLSPAHGDPTELEFKKVEVRRNTTKDRPRATSGLSVIEETRAEGVHAHDLKNALALKPEDRTPVALTRDRGQSVYNGYDISWMLREGRNRVQIRLTPARFATDLAWAPKLALDAEATLASGQTVRFQSDHTWKVRRATTGTQATARRVLVGGPALKTAGSLPRLRWRGYAFDPSVKVQRWWDYLVRTVGACFVLCVVLLSCIRWVRGLQAASRAMRALQVGILFPLVFSGTLIALSWAFKEMEEVMFFMVADFWALALLITALLLLAEPVRVWLRARCRGGPDWRILGVRTAFCSICLLAVFARAWRIDFQPLDDDEYASVQAVLSIADDGTPAFEPDGIFYTRSPLYHYLTAAVVKVFGANLWSLRLPSVFFGLLTVVLVYYAGSRLLGSRTCGLAAMLLTAIHPFEIFTGHLARFYQQQQFFALLTVVLFVKVFAQRGGLRMQLALIASYMGAVLSQEISVVMGLQLLFGFAFFMPFPKRAALFKLALFAGCMLALMVVDVAAFKILCLTRTEGVSPSTEATIRPNFYYPYNFVALLLGYSRTHLFLSVFWLVSLLDSMLKGRREALVLHFTLFSGIVLTNVLVTHVSLRYQYWLIPVWILLGVDGIKATALRLSNITKRFGARTDGRAPAYGMLLLVGVMASWAPWRIPGSYSSKLLGDGTGAFRFIASHLRPGDAVAATEPHAHAALIETG